MAGRPFLGASDAYEAHRAQGGVMMVFDSYEDACASLKPGYAVGALDLLRATVVSVMEAGK